MDKLPQSVPVADRYNRSTSRGRVGLFGGTLTVVRVEERRWGGAGLALAAFLGLGPAAAGDPVVSVDPPSGILMAFVEDPGNAADSSGLGAVAVSFRIAVYEVTNQQWIEFLNAVAADDPNELYNVGMTDSDRGGIVRNGSAGSYTYALKPNFADKPANWFSW